MAAQQQSSLAERILRVDAATAEAIAPYSENPAVAAVSLLSDAGDQPPLLGLCAGVALAGLAAGDQRLFNAGLRMGAAHLLATATKNFVKARIDRTRPRSARGEAGGRRMRPGRSDAKEETSFPSGHAAGAVAVARAFARDYPEARGAAYGAGALLALAQVPRCAHYPSDTAAGALIGVAAEAAVSLLLPRPRPFD